MVTDIICYHGNSCLMYFVRCTLCKSMHLELEACMRDVNLWGSKKKVIYKSWQKFWLKKRYCCQVYKVSELKLLSWSAQYSLDFSIVSCSRLFFNPAVFLCQVQLGVVWYDEVFSCGSQPHSSLSPNYGSFDILRIE